MTAQPAQHARTQVGIVGAGPAGLMLSHLLSAAGIGSVVIETRTREDIEATIRAGILEQGTVDLMVSTGVGDRLLDKGSRHDGIEIRFGGGSHRVDFRSSVGRSVYLYPQHEVLRDLIAARLADDGDIRFGASEVSLHGVTGTEPVIHFTDADGRPTDLRCDLIAGCDGAQGTTKWSIPDGRRTDHFRAYRHGWFGILAEAPPSSKELIYAHSDRGFALISSRTPTVQRMYFQCDPEEDADSWSDNRIWDELQSRVAGRGFSLNEGRIFQRSVIPMRSYICDPMQHGRLFLAGDAAHTVPPTGAKGLNLAISDAVVLAQALERFFGTGHADLLEGYGRTAAQRVWRAQHFSWWMTSMLHLAPDAGDFDRHRQLAELDQITGSAAGRTLLAESYTGWPIELTNPRSVVAEALSLTHGRWP
ncbi:4-hydroxybenzoate 3-monooxygenase [Saccharopolyspora mangrovi]|uniref:4-hydroxybenzoate 3-monooxygenase n=1 Tax=Saccharopolyspora mangrovi TaxID=3082379 RepID=A0ABU6AGA1_9PSEU|nr:4-hydroxybenzoate 3-monooxygenase [Saccharopolyspora sp. S2-29]MEB3370487.1 4-hydroxybenzoate 3-monooxygenase [Saccharopolyspora sp. S2-29]